MIGSCFVLEADSLAEIEAFNCSDPFAKVGLWKTVSIRPFASAWTTADVGTGQDRPGGHGIVGAQDAVRPRKRARDITVVRAVEPNMDAVRDLCAAKGVSLSADYADALNDPQVEAVVLATPHSLHTRQIEQAVAAGKHVFCEKPLALTADEPARSVALCADAGLVLGMGHERRWEPPVADMLARAAARDLGRIQQIEANFSHDKFVSLDRDNWRVKACGAPADGMTATGIHLLDLSVRLLGRAESVLCVCEQLSSDLPKGDTVAAYVKFAGGGTSGLVCLVRLLH